MKLRIRGQRQTAWDQDSPYVCIIWRRKGKGGQPIKNADGQIKTFASALGAETYGREYLRGNT